MYKKNKLKIFVCLFDKSLTLNSLFTYPGPNFPIDGNFFPAFVLADMLQAIEK